MKVIFEILRPIWPTVESDRLNAAVTDDSCYVVREVSCTIHWASGFCIPVWITCLRLVAGSCLRRLFADLSPRRPGFDTRSVHVGFVVDRVALGRVFLRVFRFCSVSIIPLNAAYSFVHLSPTLYNSS